jgi:lipopolysaccharide O-acetyltransferase
VKTAGTTTTWWPGTKHDPLTGEVTAARRPSEIVHIRPHVTPLAARILRTIVHRVRWWRWRMSLASIGPKARIDCPVWMIGGESIALGAGAWVWRHSRLEALNAQRGVTRIAIGDDAVIQPFVHIGAIDSVKIGRGCLFASHVYITDHDHEFSDPMDPVLRNDRVSAAPVRIGDYVWLGERAMVLKGVTIGERSIIGAGSIVTRDVPPLSIAVGSPARVVSQWSDVRQRWERVKSP